MKFEGTTRIEATRHEVWELLDHLDEIGGSLSGLLAFTAIVPGKRCRAVAAGDFGRYRPTLELEVERTGGKALREIRLCVRGKGSGSHLGASVCVVLSDACGRATNLRWSFFLAASGRLARVEGWLLETELRRAATALVRQLCGRLARRSGRRPSRLVA